MGTRTGLKNDCICISSSRSSIFIASVCSVVSRTLAALDRSRKHQSKYNFPDVLKVPFQTSIMMFVVKCFLSVLVVLNLLNYAAVLAKLEKGTRYLSNIIFKLLSKTFVINLQ